jgi:glutathione S-transferase
MYPNGSDGKITLYHAPNTRSSATLLLLQELGLPYDLHVLNMKAGENRQPPYLAINPMGKVPTIKHGDAIITEQVAIYIYLTDLVPEAALAPIIGDPQRGPYLRWLVFYGSAFEPAVTDRALQREPGRPGMMPYGDFDTMFATVVKQLESGPYMLGEIFSAADLLWGTALNWMTQWKLVPTPTVLTDYVERITSRPLFAEVKARDAEIAAQQGG